MKRLYLILCVTALLAVGGCGRTKTVWVYRWDVLRQETTSDIPGEQVFGETKLASANLFGRDDVAGVSLNDRSEPKAWAGDFDQGGFVGYRLYYHDRQDNYDGYRRAGYGRDGYFRRSFRYYRTGTWAR